ncbi:MAG: ECF transporter S component [Lachnospiraceae bacterium]|jgi:uncharacterized membrane protein|nr:ECF transporter S component [Lachnospiraceae bacterium]
MNKENKTVLLALTALFVAIILVMAFVPYLGYIPLGFMNATTVHIPVIIGAILLGPKRGAFLGLVFGLTSLWKNTFTPNATSFVFSPFVQIGEHGGNISSLVICLVPRILIGVVAYFVFRLFLSIFERFEGKDDQSVKTGGYEKRTGKKLWATWTASVVAGVAGSITNTLLVMNLIYVLFGAQYAAARNMAGAGLYAAIIGVIVMNGIPEAIVAGILTGIISPVLINLKNRNFA